MLTKPEAICGSRAAGSNSTGELQCDGHQLRNYLSQYILFVPVQCSSQTHSPVGISGCDPDPYPSIIKETPLQDKPISICSKTGSSLHCKQIRMTSFFNKMEHLMVRAFLDEKVPQRWIGRKGAQDLALCAWPTRSPDLTVCDFFLRGYVKDHVYVPPLPTNLDDLKHRITTAINSVHRDMLIRAWEEFSYRIDVAHAAGGGYIEHL
ncbi:hypothetical protein B7P43_G16752 [Cryptotermes secundus]|uniref:Uncharacterized protein n=1 Tax=Cryptotermes secundus TaxID=105785 RepID=A0A2J7QII7_9NEOP|nr:hypothetical protein B7P43_G16752 [Cryptotermes secundus]